MKKERSMEKFYILPHSPILRTATLDQQIYWFEKSLQKWIFEPAKLLLDTGDESFDIAILSILNAVPELLAKCQGYEKTYINESIESKRPSKSEYLYGKGIEYIFKDLGENVFTDDELIKLLYVNLRCELAHFAYIGEKIYLTRNKENLSSFIIKIPLDHIPGGWTYHPSPPLVSINVLQWFSKTNKRVGDYINDLQNPANADCRLTFSEHITCINSLKDNSSTGCICNDTQLCVNCALEKFPDSHLSAQ